MNNENLNDFLNEYEKKLKELGYAQKASATRKSALKKVITGFCDSNPKKFEKRLKNRESYSKLTNEIIDKDVYSSKCLNAISVYLKVNNISIDYKINEVNQLIKDYARIVNSLGKYEDIIRTSNIVGEYAEFLCEHYLGIKRASPNVRAYDGTKNGIKYQIKSRWIHSNNNGEDEFGKINLNEDRSPKDFDSFIGIVFDRNLKVIDVYVLDKENIKKYFSSSKGKKAVIKVNQLKNNKNGIVFDNTFDREIEIIKNL